MRCKACDAVLDKRECQWDEERKEHEDLCYICRGIIAKCEEEYALTLYAEDECIDTSDIALDDED